MLRIAATLLVLIGFVTLCRGQQTTTAREAAANGADAFQRGNYDEAIADYQQAIRLGGVEPSTFIDRRYEALVKGDFRTNAVLGEDLRLESKLAKAYLYRGDERSRKREFDKAIADFSEAVRLEPANAVAYGCRGHAWKAKGEYDKAIADFDICVKLAPSNHQAFGNRGNVWRAKREYAKALADYHEALRLAPDSPYEYNSLAWILATCPDVQYRDGAKAIEYATKACELDGWKSPRFVTTLAAAYAEAGKFDEAIQWQEKAIDLTEGEDCKESARKRLEHYQWGEPYRENPKDSANEIDLKDALADS